MAHFYRYETAGITLNFTPTAVLEDYEKIIVSLRQNGNIQIDKDESELGIDVENGTILINLSQEETGKFEGNSKILVQVNIYYDDESRNVSTIGEIQVYDNLYKKVITNE